MRILLSPTKKMRTDTDTLLPRALPELLDRTRLLLQWLQQQSPEQLQALWGCSDAIARQNIRRLQDMDLEQQLTPAVLASEGLAFQHMAPTVFTDAQFAYVQAHLRILSGFYGVLRPLDGIRPSRLEMQTGSATQGFADLYGFWDRTLYDRVTEGARVLVNLASKEYSKCITPYLSGDIPMITCQFCERVRGKLVQKGTFAKMARGEMVRYLAEQQADRPEQMQQFDRLGFQFRPELSDSTQYIFERIPE